MTFEARFGSNDSDVTSTKPGRDTEGLLVRPTMYWPPTFMTPQYWAESARQFGWVSPATPLAQRPALEFEISADVTLGEVLEAACDAWEIFEGPDMLKYGPTRTSELHRFGFIRVPDDEEGIDEQTGYAWPSKLPVARDDGTTEYVPAMEVTYRELLASSALGLIEGDVMRPYVYPKSPQGVPAAPSELANLSADAVRAAYASADQLGHQAVHLLRRIGPDVAEADAVAMTIYGHAEAVSRLRSWWRKRQNR